MDFYEIKVRPAKKGVLEAYPNYIVGKTNDLMIRGKSFYAIWDEEARLWSTDEYDVARLVDEEMQREAVKLEQEHETRIRVKYLRDFSSRSWTGYRTYLSQAPDNAHDLDAKLTFQNTKVRKTDYVSRRLPYSLESGPIDAYNELMSTLYLPEERQKLEWAIGSIISGDSKHIQKFIVLFGGGGTGKSTFLNILQGLFPGYYTMFDAKALTSASNSFAAEVFKHNPLIAIQHDGDLSRIEDNSMLNSIVSHEEIQVNEKFKPKYTLRSRCLLFMATNTPVRITDSNSGVIRRLIDVHPSGETIPTDRYFQLMKLIKSEYGAIAQHCLDVYLALGKDYYANYKPIDMMERTDFFYNFVDEHFYTWAKQDHVTLADAWNEYKAFCEENNIKRRPMQWVKSELKSYFSAYYDRIRIEGVLLRKVYTGLLVERFRGEVKEVEHPIPEDWLALDKTSSIFDNLGKSWKAQYANEETGAPKSKWSYVRRKLKDIDTSQLHYVLVPDNHIVIDFDLRDENGEKSAKLNFEAASKWPATYAEYSKSQAGIHLHYIWDGDPHDLSRVYDEGIEIKVFSGNAALRRKLSYCNDFPIATINSGLPLKEKKVVNFEAVKSEQGLRDLIARNLRKEIHPGTKPSVDFIYKILEDAYSSGLHYDISDMAQAVLVFAANSTNQAQYCLKIVSKMKFKSDEPSDTIDYGYSDDRLVFYDVEVFPNVLIVVWKYQGAEHKPVYMINPGPEELEKLFKLKLVGFNNRRYDNHILYGRYMGYDNQRLYELSTAIIEGKRRALFGEAYGLSYADVYDFSSKKQSLKKFQIDLGIHHQELTYPWNEPLAEEHWQEVLDYCANDVISTEKTFESRKQDFVARQILAALSGLTVNDSTQQHTARIIFGKDRTPQTSFVYTDLSIMFPGYKFESGKSSYKGEDPGEGGYVYSEPGFYRDVALLDVASMHPTSIKELNLFGPYTKQYTDLMDARLAIKRHDYEKAKKMFNGVLTPYLGSEEEADDLAYALKIVINIVYGLTSAKFDNKFRDLRNVDNIVAKRGALFMIDLKEAVQDKGFQVIHVKTDSIKIPGATKELIDFVIKFGQKYGYIFEHEATYDRFCLVNDAVYIARDTKDGHWTAIGAEFQHPYIFKTLFSHEPIIFEDLCEVKAVTTEMYLDMNEQLGEDEHNYIFVGKAGLFCPIAPGKNGGLLYRKKDDKYYAVTRTKGYRWLQAEEVLTLGKEQDIDRSYFRKLADDAIMHIEEYISFDEFTK